MGTSYNTNVVTDGLVYYADAGNRRSYPGAGTTLTDLVNGNNGTLENMSASYGFDSEKGGIIRFDGSNDHVEIGAYGVNSVLNWGSGNGTVGVWMRSLAVGGSLIGMGAAGSGGKRYVIQYNNSGNRISFAMDNDVTLTAANGSDTDGLTDGKWHYVVGMRNGQYIYLYVDGVLDATTDLGAGYGSVDYTSDGGLYMGGLWHVGDTVSHNWNGNLALAHIYNRALSAAEVKQNYEATKSRFVPRITKSNLELNFDAGDPESYVGGTTWKDTANGISAAFQNMDVANFNSANGGYLEFDGTDEWIKVAESGGWSMQGWAALTMETWINVAGSRWHRILYENQNDASTYSFRVSTDLYGTASAFWLAAGSSASVAESSFFSTSVWFQYVCRWDGTTMNVYKNGVKVPPLGSGTSNSGTIESSSGSKGGVAIGAGYATGEGLQSESETFYGKMGLLRVYQGALSAAEILDNYNKTKARFGH